MPRATAWWLIAITGLAGLSGCSRKQQAGGSAPQAQTGQQPPAPSRPTADLAGYTTPQQFEQHAAASAADVQFYLAVMQAAIARMQSPPPGDQAAMAYFQKWTATGTQAEQEALAAMRTGNYAAAAKAGNNALPRTPQVDLAQALLAGDAARLVAEERGMPGRQWSSLAGAVEDGAHPCRTPLPPLNDSKLAQTFQLWTMGCYGGDTNMGGFAGMSPAQWQQANAQAAQDIREILASRQVIAPYASRVRQVQVDYACAIPGDKGKCKLARAMQALGG